MTAELSHVVIHTDGACSGNPGPGGWGAILTFGDREKEIKGGEALTTNNRMELTAAISALEALKRPCRVDLHTDSQYLRARIITLHVRVEPGALEEAQREKVTIEPHDIIYKLFDALKELIKGAKEPVIIKQKIGQAEVRKVFPIKGVGVIAGCYVQDGRFTSQSSVVVWRGPKKIGEGKISSLQRDRKSVKEVLKGFECAFMIDKYTDWEVGDRVEAYIETRE